jgi:hypothetical protein
MTSWEQFKTTAQQEKDALDAKFTDTDITSKVSQMNTALSRYVSRAGISTVADSASDPDYATAQSIFQGLTSGVNQYSALNKRMAQQLGNLSGNADIQNKLKQVGELRQDIPRLEKELADTRLDLETAKARQQNADKPVDDTSFYQGFSAKVGFTKPLHTYSIPVLIGFGLLLLFLSGLMLRDFFTPTIGNAYGSSVYDTDGVFSLFTDSRFYSVASGATFVFAVVGILAYSGFLGQTLK